MTIDEAAYHDYVEHIKHTEYVYKLSFYKFRGSKLFWLYDTETESLEDNYYSQPCSHAAVHGITPSLMVVQRPMDIVCFHNERNEWKLHQ